MKEEFLRGSKGRQRSDHSEPGGHSKEFRFSFKYNGGLLEDFKVREWECLVYNSKNWSIYGGRQGAVSQLGGDEMQGCHGNGVGKRWRWPRAAEMAKNGGIRDTYWMTANRQTGCREEKKRYIKISDYFERKNNYFPDLQISSACFKMSPCSGTDSPDLPNVFSW